MKRWGAKIVKDLHRANICFQSATTTEANLADYFRARKLRFTAFAFDRMEEAWGALLAAHCVALTADISALHAIRAGNAQHAKDYVVLAQAISKEPFSPAVRQGDDQFADIMRWTLYAMVEAEEHGITSKNVDEMLKSGHPTIKNILGVTPGMGKALGVDEKWVYDIVKQVETTAKATTATWVTARR